MNLAKMEPLALLLYQKLLPGSQLVNRLQDLRYRVQSLNTASGLTEIAEKSLPMVLLVDLASPDPEILSELRRFHQNAATRHIPIIAFGVSDTSSSQQAAMDAGVTLMVSESAILNHLPECLSRALEVD
jgi:PleD family two-component response regulator